MKKRNKQHKKPRPGAHLKPVRNDKLVAMFHELEDHLLSASEPEHALVFKQHFWGPVRFPGKNHKFAALLIGPPGVGKTLYGKAFQQIHGPGAVVLTAEQAAIPGYELPPHCTYLQIDDLTAAGRVERTANIRRWLDGTVCIYLTSNCYDCLDIDETDQDFFVLATPDYPIQKQSAR